jgi:hypothetical protein
MKQNSQNMKREQARAFKLWTWMTLLSVVGAYLFTWLLLLVLEAAPGNL